MQNEAFWIMAALAYAIIAGCMAGIFNVSFMTCSRGRRFIDAPL